MKPFFVGLLILSLSRGNGCKKDCPDPVPGGCATDLTSGLVAYYPFNGNFKDASGHGLHAIAQNGAALGTDYLGRANRAATFDGIDDFAFVPGNARLNTAEMTLSFQVMVNTVNRRHVTVSRINYYSGKGLAFGVHQSFDEDNRWSFGISPAAMDCSEEQQNDPDLVINSPVTTEAGRWYSVIAVFGARTQKLYIDGVLVATKNQPFNTLKQCSASDLMIGGWWSYDLVSLDGKLDEVRLYNRVLTDCEIAKLADVFKQ